MLLLCLDKANEFLTGLKDKELVFLSNLWDLLLSCGFGPLDSLERKDSRGGGVSITTP